VLPLSAIDELEHQGPMMATTGDGVGAAAAAVLPPSTSSSSASPTAALSPVSALSTSAAALELHGSLLLFRVCVCVSIMMWM
jgi:hypothetical protein